MGGWGWEEKRCRGWWWWWRLRRRGRGRRGGGGKDAWSVGIGRSEDEDSTVMCKKGVYCKYPMRVELLNWLSILALLLFLSPPSLLPFADTSQHCQETSLFEPKEIISIALLCILLFRTALVAASHLRFCFKKATAHPTFANNDEFANRNWWARWKGSHSPNHPQLKPSTSISSLPRPIPFPTAVPSSETRGKEARPLPVPCFRRVSHPYI